MSDDWKTKPRSTMKDARGRWSLRRIRAKHRIRFVKDGFDHGCGEID